MLYDRALKLLGQGARLRTLLPYPCAAFLIQRKNALSGGLCTPGRVTR